MPAKEPWFAYKEIKEHPKLKGQPDLINLVVAEVKDGGKHLTQQRPM